jgi:hypothetical protein
VSALNSSDIELNKAKSLVLLTIEEIKSKRIHKGINKKYYGLGRTFAFGVKRKML